MRLAILFGQLGAADAELYGGRLAAPLRAAGLDVVITSLSAPDQLDGVDVATPLLCWSYHTDENAWRASLEAVEAAGVPLINPAELLLWNTRKTYLSTLQSAGADIVPTRFINAPTDSDIEAARQAFGGGTVVVKPQVSAGSKQTLRLAPGDRLRDGPTGPAMIQPFLDGILTEGELSVFLFGGRFSHAVRKTPAAGDFRVQPQFGARLVPVEPPPGALDLALAAIAAAPVPPVYARADMVRDAGGRLRLMELELIEPDLYLQLAADGGAAFAGAMKAAMRG